VSARKTEIQVFNYSLFVLSKNNQFSVLIHYRGVLQYAPTFLFAILTSALLNKVCYIS